MFLVTFLNADSKPRAVFAAATIEFVADFNVWWEGGFPGILIVSVMLIPPLISRTRLKVQFNPVESKFGWDRNHDS